MNIESVNTQKCQQGFSLLELILVLVVIGILAATGLEYYNRAMDDSRRAGVETLSNNFTAAVSGVHGQWIVEGKPRHLTLDNMTVYLNQYGWPVGSQSTRKQNPDACNQLWQTLLQNPAPASVEGRGVAGSYLYHISAPNPRTCRYELVVEAGDSHYFDYSTYTGKVSVVVPPMGNRG